MCQEKRRNFNAIGDKSAVFIGMWLATRVRLMNNGQAGQAGMGILEYKHIRI